MRNSEQINEHYIYQDGYNAGYKDGKREGRIEGMLEIAKTFKETVLNDEKKRLDKGKG